MTAVSNLPQQEFSIVAEKKVSARYSTNQHLAGRDFTSLSHAERVALVRNILDNKIHGIAFSPYLDGQQPGDDLSEQQIEQRLKVIQPYTRWIRTFSCTEGNENIPRLAKKHGLKTMVGVCLSDDREMNEIEFNNAIEIARQGHVDILAVGNEVLLRGDISENELLDYIYRAKREVLGLTVTYVDAYYLFEQHRRLVGACDVLMINCYPFWEGCPAEYALLYMKDMYNRVVKIAAGKEVVISETGWPVSGEPYGAAQPSYENAMRYFINTYEWATQEDIDVFYFSSFDEAWKTGDEGDVGAYWGLWDKDGSFKYK